MGLTELMERHLLLGLLLLLIRASAVISAEEPSPLLVRAKGEVAGEQVPVLTVYRAGSAAMAGTRLLLEVKDN